MVSEESFNQSINPSASLLGHFESIDDLRTELNIPHSEKIFGAKEAYDYVNRCWSCYQTVVTAAVSNSHRVDGIAVEVQQPNYEKEELAYLKMTAKESYEQMEQVRERLLEILHYQKNRLAYRKRTEIAVDIVRQLESEGQFKDADYAFDQGV